MNTSKSIAKYHGKAVSGHKSSAVAHLASDGRAFHVGDYRKSAALIKAMRRDNHGHLKNEQQQERIDMLAAAMAAVFETDAHEFGVPFGPGYFIAGTR